MTIIFCLDYYFPNIGGGEVLFTHLAEAMAEQGHTVKVITQHSAPDLPFFEKINGVEVHRIKTPTRILFAATALLPLWRLSKGADIIHTSIFPCAFPSYLVGRIRKIPRIITIFEVYQKLWFRFLSFIPACISYYGEKALLSLSYDRVLTISRYSANSLRLVSRKVTDDKLITIYPGVDRGQWKHTTEITEAARHILEQAPGKKVLFFGRPAVAKGLEYVIRSIPHLKDASVTLIAVTPFSDPRAEVLKQLTQELGLQQRVHFHNSLPLADLISLASHVDTITIPSLAEGFGFVAADSSTLNKPLVVSECCSLPEAVSGEVVFVRPGDPQDIARGIDQALRGETVHIPHKEFPWKDFIEGHAAVYQDLLKS